MKGERGVAGWRRWYRSLEADAVGSGIGRMGERCVHGYEGNGENKG